MILQISFVAVHTAEFCRYLEEMQSKTLPGYEAADGLIFVALFQRELIAYTEVAMISTWRTKQQLTKFLDRTVPGSINTVNHIVMGRGAATYELVTVRPGKLADADDFCGFKEGAD
jgi:hypothetical protein